MAAKGAFNTLFVIFLVVVAALSGMAVPNSFMGEYKRCFRRCQAACEAEGKGSTFCEIKCDTECLAKETAAKLNMKP